MTRLQSGARKFPPALTEEDRRAQKMIILVHVAKKDLKLSDELYRDILEDLTKKRSAADCSTRQLGLVLDHFKARGWEPQPGARGSKPADHKPAGKARALWISLYHLGAVTRRSDPALEAFGRRQLGCERLQWADQRQMFRLIEALKAIGERSGWSQDTAGVKPEAVPVVLRRRLVEAIFEKLVAAGAAPPDSTAAEEAAALGVEIRSVLTATASELEKAAKALGARLRAVRA